jgi:DNA-directed RNA polymerase subunit RPC12/RpoP
MVKGNRDFFTCTACGKRFTFWTLDDNPHPKVKCYYCGTEAFPKGEPPAAPAPAPAAPPAAPVPPAPPASANGGAPAT